MMKYNNMTEYLESLAKSNSSTEVEDRIMEKILRRIGFEHAIVTSGIVYIEGHGTLDSPPMSINRVAKSLLKV